jgi:YVTN family beta-propeller protein
MSSSSNYTVRAVLWVLAAVAGCSSSSEPRLTAPASIVVQNAPPTTAIVGANITPVPRFVVKDSGGHALGNVSVFFYTTPGATVTPTTVVTDANGVAQPSAWLLGTHVGNMVLTASIAAPSVSTSITVVAQPGPAATLQLPPSASLGLTDSVSIGLALDAYGNALPATALNLSSSNTAVATIGGGKVIAQSAGSAVVTVSVPGTALSGTVAVTVFERFGHLSGRPFGIAYVSGSPGKILVSSLDVNALSFVNGSTFGFTSLVNTSATPSDVFVNSAGTAAYVSAVDGAAVTVVNVTSAASSGAIAEPGSARVLLSPDGSKLYVGKNGGLDVFAMPAGTLTKSISLPGSQMNGLAISSDGSVLYASERFSGKVWRYNTATMTATDSISTGGSAQDVVLHEASGNVYVANESGWVDVFSAANLATVTRINNIGGAFAMRLTADGSKLYVSGTQAGVVYIIDRASGTVDKMVPVGGAPRRIAFLPDGRALVANEAGYVSLVH